MLRQKEKSCIVNIFRQIQGSSYEEIIYKIIANIVNTNVFYITKNNCVMTYVYRYQ